MSRMPHCNRSKDIFSNNEQNRSNWTH